METLEIPVIRTKRKSLAIQVERDGSITVRAPLKVSDREIQRFVRDNRSWVEKHWKRKESRKPVVKNFEEGEMFFYLGRGFPLAFVESQSRALHFDDMFTLRARDRARARDHFLRWYKKRARAIIEERLAHFRDELELEHRKIRLTSAKYTWGSCTPQNNLNFTWRLVMAPPEILDYIVVHELCHTRHKNHGKRFWNLVGKGCADYKDCRMWLNNNSHLLQI